MLEEKKGVGEGDVPEEEEAVGWTLDVTFRLLGGV